MLDLVVVGNHVLADALGVPCELVMNAINSVLSMNFHDVEDFFGTARTNDFNVCFGEVVRIGKGMSCLCVGLMSAALVFGVFRFPNVVTMIPLTWAAISFGLVASAYGGVGARIFAKQSNGTIRTPMRFLLFPFLAYTWVVWHIYRFVSREDPFNTIDDELVINSP